MSIRIKDCIFLGRPKIGQDRVENVLAVDRSAPFGTRLLAAWTLLFGAGLLRLVSSWRSRNVRFTPTHGGEMR